MRNHLIALLFAGICADARPAHTGKVAWRPDSSTALGDAARAGQPAFVWVHHDT